MEGAGAESEQAGQPEAGAAENGGQGGAITAVREFAAKMEHELSTLEELVQKERGKRQAAERQAQQEARKRQATEAQLQAEVKKRKAADAMCQEATEMAACLEEQLAQQRASGQGPAAQPSSPEHAHPPAVAHEQEEQAGPAGHVRRSGRLATQQQGQQQGAAAEEAAGGAGAQPLGTSARAAPVAGPSFQLKPAAEGHSSALPLPGEVLVGEHSVACVLEAPARAVLAAAAASGVEGLPQRRKATAAAIKASPQYCEEGLEAGLSKDHIYQLQRVLHNHLPDSGKAVAKAADLPALLHHLFLAMGVRDLGGCWERGGDGDPQLVGGLAEVHAVALLVPAASGRAASPFEDGIVLLARLAGANNARSLVLRRPATWDEGQGSEGRSAAGSQISKETTLDALFYVSPLDGGACRAVSAVLAEAVDRLAPGAAAGVQQEAAQGMLTLRVATFGFLGRDAEGAARYVTRPLSVQLGLQGRRLVWGPSEVQAQLPPIPWFLALEEADLPASLADNQRRLWEARRPLARPAGGSR